MAGQTLSDCFSQLDCALVSLEACKTAEEEWSVIKKAYFKKILQCHPDKGGDAETFRDVRAP